MLDYAANVSEALELIGKYNVYFDEVPIHYMVADAAGNSAVIEYLNGKPVVLRGSGGWQVSTNFVISEEKPDGANSSCRRYNTLESALSKTKGVLDAGAGKKMLKNVAQEGSETDHGG